MTEWVYGNHKNLGWGCVKVFNTLNIFEYMDFDPEFECKSDVKRYWRNRKHILALQEMTLWKYTKTLLKGIVIYRKLMRY